MKMKKIICMIMSIMMVAMSGCQSSSAASLDYEQHYKTTGTAMKESALSDRWESKGSKVAVVS